jgi:hypothetical protein
MSAQFYFGVLPLFAVVAFAQSSVPPQPTPTAQDSKTAKVPAAPTSTNGPALEMMTKNYSGILVEASCVAGSATTPAGNSAKPVPDKTGAKSTAGDANHAATADQGQSCTVTTSTTQFAIRLKDGQILKLDDVGNQRVQELLKNRKKWSDAVAAGKAIHVDSSGVLSGDKLIALSVN